MGHKVPFFSLFYYVLMFYSQYDFIYNSGYPEHASAGTDKLFRTTALHELRSHEKHTR